MKLFEMKHIKKSFGALDVLRDISLEVDQGEVAQHHRPFWFRQVHPAPLRHRSGNPGLRRNHQKWKNRPGIPELQSFPPFFRHQKYC